MNIWCVGLVLMKNAWHAKLGGRLFRSDVRDDHHGVVRVGLDPFSPSLKNASGWGCILRLL